jgi:hypothetical protein
MVVLAKVAFGPPTAPSVSVQPLRRRVLSNADLTYLSLWIVERLICAHDLPPSFPEPELPTSTVECASEAAACSIEAARRVANTVIPVPSTPEQAESVAKNIFYLGAVLGKQAHEIPVEQLVPAVEGVFGGLDREAKERLGELAREIAPAMQVQDAVNAMMRETLALDPSNARFQPVRVVLTRGILAARSTDPARLAPEVWTEVSNAAASVGPIPPDAVDAIETLARDRGLEPRAEAELVRLSDDDLLRELARRRRVTPAETPPVTPRARPRRRRRDEEEPET